MECHGKNVIIELTYECNFACPYCYVPWHDHPEIRKPELTTSEWKSIIRDIGDAGASSITFTGGEPLMRTDAIELIEYAKKETFIPRLIVYTNLGMANDRFFDAVDDARVSVSSSLQGCATISEMSGCPRSIDEFAEACRRISSSRAELSIGVTVTKVNACEIEDILYFADSLHPITIQAGVLMVEGRAKRHPELWMSFNEIVEVHKRIESCRSSLQANLVVINELFCSCRMDSVKPAGLPADYMPDTCIAARDYVVLGPDGSRRKCMHTY